MARKQATALVYAYMSGNDRKRLETEEKLRKTLLSE
jgi:hypothetical protein